MLNFLRKLLGRKPVSRPLDEDADLEQFFTDAEHALQVFEQLVSATRLPKHLLVIHGVGGVGKSTVLKMYRLSCRRQRIPVVLVAGEEAPSPVDMLADWADDLSGDDVKLSTFQSTLTHYRALQAKVEAEAKKAGQVAEKLGKAAAKTAVEMAASTIPVVGPLVSALGGAGAEAFVDWLRGFLSKPDLDLYLDPTKRLTDDFITDLTHAATGQRIVLMADTYEQMTTLDDWVRDLARRLPENVLLVIAGRAMPEWDRAWPGWMGRAEIVELKEMAPEDLRTLVRRYYAHIRDGEPDPQQVEAVVRFARGLPMAATTVVQLWVRHGVEDFEAVKPQVVADMVDRLLEGVPSKMRPAFEVAAALRYFNADALQALLDGGDADGLYAELRRWPFIRSRREGLAVHDTMREMMNEALRVRTPEGFRPLHERAARYYEARVEKAIGEERERFILEKLYHLIQSGQESTAITESQAVIETALAFHQRLFAESILALLTQYIQQDHNRYWLAYLRYRVTFFNPSIEIQVTQAKVLEKVLKEPCVEPRLCALIASALAKAPGEVNIPPDRRIELLTKAMDSGQLLPQEVANGYRHLGDLYWGKGEWTRALDSYTQVIQSHRSQLGLLGEIKAFGGQAYIYLLMGEWSKSVESAQEAVALARQVGENILASELKGLGWAYSYRGELDLASRIIQESLRLAQQSQDEANIIRISRRLAEIYDRQKRWSLSVSLYRNLIARDEKHGRVISRCSLLALLGISYRKQGLFKEAEQLLLESLAHIEVAVEPIALNGLGELYLALNRLHEARQYFERAVSVSKGRPYYLAKATLGLLAVELASSAFGEMAGKSRQVENLSIERSYHDHLASLRMIQGHIASEGHIPEWGSGFNAALHFYQQALIYALRYNRFLLDEVLLGGGVTTPLRPIIPHCLERVEEGRRMLIALRDWWQTGINDDGTPRPDAISPIPEGISLLEGERIAREREPGDGSPQRTVVEQIEAALA